MGVTFLTNEDKEELQKSIQANADAVSKVSEQISDIKTDIGEAETLLEAI